MLIDFEAQSQNANLFMKVWFQIKQIQNAWKSI